MKSAAAADGESEERPKGRIEAQAVQDMGLGWGLCRKNMDRGVVNS